jgi:hypothetical protein
VHDLDPLLHKLLGYQPPVAVLRRAFGTEDATRPLRGFAADDVDAPFELVAARPLSEALIAGSAQLVSHVDVIDALAGSECLQAVAPEVLLA